jgi:hypothetical protein
VKNLDETDVDCGGAEAPKCADTKACKAPTDCTSKVCTGDVCQAPTKTDGVQNGDESDVDCGGTTTGADRCAPGKVCAVNEDCSSKGCNYDKKCAAGRTCTQKAGGTTCGAGETGTAGADHEDCCTRLSSTGGPQGAFKVDKYLITAGRMRAFLDALNGKVRDYFTNAMTKPLGWNDALTKWLPNAWDTTGITDEHPNVYSAYAQVAGGITHDAPANQGCVIETATGGLSYGHPTFLVPNGTHMKNGVQVAGATALYGELYTRWMTQEQLDERALNCTNWVMLAALCAYDGGQMISRPEYDYLYDFDASGAVSDWPWGSTPVAGSSPYDGTIIGPAGPPAMAKSTACASCVDDFVNWRFNYWYPAAIPNGATENDESRYISAPGRFPKGGGRELTAGDPKSRVQDLAGLMIEATSTTTANKNYTLTDSSVVNLPGVVWRGGSWEGHAIATTWNNGEFTYLSKYGKLGSRCVYY